MKATPRVHFMHLYLSVYSKDKARILCARPNAPNAGCGPAPTPRRRSSWRRHDNYCLPSSWPAKATWLTAAASRAIAGTATSRRSASQTKTCFTSPPLSGGRRPWSLSTPTSASTRSTASGPAWHLPMQSLLWRPRACQRWCWGWCHVQISQWERWGWLYENLLKKAVAEGGRRRRAAEFEKKMVRELTWDLKLSHLPIIQVGFFH